MALSTPLLDKRKRAKVGPLVVPGPPKLNVSVLLPLIKFPSGLPSKLIFSEELHTPSRLMSIQASNRPVLPAGMTALTVMTLMTRLLAVLGDRLPMITPSSPASPLAFAD